MAWGYQKIALQFLLPIAALFGLAACSGGNSSGTGMAEVSVTALLASEVKAAEMSITGPLVPTPISVSLAASGSNDWNALVNSLPVGSSYVFTVWALDAAGNRLYGGFATGIAILKDQVTTVKITAQQLVPSDPYKNAVPIIDAIIVSSTNILPGGAVSAKVTAHDSDALDTLAFAWSASSNAGTFSTATTTTTTWTAPDTQGDYTLTCVVKDNHGASSTATVIVHVSVSNGQGNADISVSLNTWPVVTDLITAPGFIESGKPVAISVVASDADQDPLTYAWTSTCSSGAFNDSRSPVTNFTLSVGATDTRCVFDVIVRDNRGGSITAQTTLMVGKPANLELPTIISSMQSPSVVEPGKPVVFSIVATDPQKSVLSFAWSATAGALSNQINGAGTSRVTWTAPTAVTSITVSVIVTDALGLATQRDFIIGMVSTTLPDGGVDGGIADAQPADSGMPFDATADAAVDSGDSRDGAVSSDGNDAGSGDAATEGLDSSGDGGTPTDTPVDGGATVDGASVEGGQGEGGANATDGGNVWGDTATGIIT